MTILLRQYLRFAKLIGAVLCLFLMHCTNESIEHNGLKNISKTSLPGDSAPEAKALSEGKTPLRITDNKLYLNDLLPFLKYQNTGRVDSLCAHLSNFTLNDFKEIAFNRKFILSSHKQDTLHLGDNQYLLGLLKTEHSNTNTILAIIDYVDAWGYSVVLLTVNANHDIIDFQTVYENHGDGGEFCTSSLKFLSKNNYQCTTEEGFCTTTSPTDTCKFTRTTKKITINDDATFSEKLVKKESELTEVTQNK